MKRKQVDFSKSTEHLKKTSAPQRKQKLSLKSIIHVIEQHVGVLSLSAHNWIRT